ncbi:MAG: molybdate ABC transporter substrate-binding protein [Alphaproteobacteria bacterium]|nr:molybdate ABC transporter substrate-binding protein [Alphaproteobacteria bacterium]MBU1512988.1 molybdate ABC transporter substrate-binding protein [Alphaproteobacteria bacterium]MBU2095096.1 molybdate ABC transporter substrate-binding protein [Alphaproteobacteria bacterium]MBU2153029.1 molybdate ABC transporter substrate-binding protein [Alphaproteobacteria bacterium]MBU2306347.1 molybdate ABC transporter substrate-binding protein [Alphaproteobacteria bacterium]
MLRRRSLFVSLFAALLVPTAAFAAEVKVAVAANFTEPAKEIAARFKVRTGHDASLSFGSSGQFYAQIANGAPFEVLLSADRERPEKAEAEGLAVAGSRFTYAIGRLVLYSKTPGLVDGKGAVLKTGRFAKIAIADPKTAPYGVAAVETMRKLGVYEALTPKLVQGTSITQAYQFIDTGAAELGFVAMSQVVTVKGGSRWTVPAANHTPIDQQAVLLKAGANNAAAKAFMTFLRGPEAKAIVRKYGYEVP